MEFYKVCKNFAWFLLIIGTISSIIIGIDNEDFILFIIWMFAVFITFLTSYGFGEIIEQLTIIANNTSSQTNSKVNSSNYATEYSKVSKFSSTPDILDVPKRNKSKGE